MKTVIKRGLLILVTFSLIVTAFVSVGAIGDVRASGPAYVSHAPISITSHSALVALRNTNVATGSGTAADPYVINGYDITGTGGGVTGGGVCINIYNITDHLVISNCFLHESWWGVEISKSSNISVTNTNSSDNYRYGVWLDHSGNNTITNNILVDGAHGIFSAGASDNIIENNSCRATRACAVMLSEHSNRNVFSNNTCFSSGDNGIYVLNYSNNNIIKNNVFKNNIGHGVHLANSYNNEVYGNDLIGNNRSSSTYNPLHKQATDTGTGNQWNTASYGNYWSDWTSPDADNNGIIDSPYLIGESSSKDNYPLASPHNPGVTVPVVTAPAAPAGLTAIAGNGQVSLAWTAPNSNGGTIDHYVVYRNGTAVGTPATTSFVDTVLNNGVTYSYLVAAHNGAGLGPNSTAVTATPQTVPGAPTALTATPGSTQVSLAWTAPSENGGAAIDYYLVYVGGVAGTTQYTTTAATITGLTNGQTYSFTVSAHNLAGNGSQSVAAASTPFTVPGTPGGLTATPGSTQVSLAWTAPSENGGAAIDYYLVYVGGVAGTTQYTTTAATITGLTNGQTYSFTVSAHNLAGNGSQTSGVSAAPNATVAIPDSPTGLAAVASDAQVSLSWTAPAGNGGAAIDYYIVYQDGTDVLHATGTSATVKSLVDGKAYGFTVAAHNSVGIGAQTSAVSATPTLAPAVPGAPTGLSAVPGSAQVSITWAAPTSNGGAAIDYYIVYQGGKDIAHPTLNSKVVTGLTNGQSYVFAIAAHNSVGTGPQTSGVSTTPTKAPAAPSTPTGLTLKAGNTQVSLSWIAPSSNGGATVDYYIVYQDGVDVSHPSTTSMNVTGLTNGQSYNFTVAAHNSAGTGVQTSAISATPSLSAIAPGVPTDLTNVAGDGIVKLSWTAPTISGSSGIDYYIIYQDGVDVVHSTGTSTTITGLTNGQTYSFTVAAHNSGGVGEQSLIDTTSPSGGSSNVGTAKSAGIDSMVIFAGILVLLAAIVAILLIVRRNRRNA